MAKSSPTLCGSIAGKIGGLGLLMHNAAYEEANLPFTYVSFEPTSAKDAVLSMRALGIRGLGVTMPYKTEVIPFLDALDETAEKIGAVNTLVNDNGVITGYNTDWSGAIRGLREKGELAGKKVALFGAGGAGKAIAYGLDREGALTTLFNGNAEKALALCDAYPSLSFGGTKDAYSKEDGYEVIINATSVGFMSEQSLLQKEDFPTGALVLDVVFNPLRTRFAALAEEAGCTVVPGSRMLTLQALAQDELYTGQTLSLSVMEKALRAYIH